LWFFRENYFLKILVREFLLIFSGDGLVRVGLVEENFADGSRNFDVLAIEFGVQCFDKFVGEREFVFEFFGAEDDGEIYVGIAELVESHERFEIWNRALDFFEDFFCNFFGGVFDDLEVGIVGHAAADVDGNFVLGEVGVDDDALGEFVVGDDDEGVGESSDSRRPPADVVDETGNVVARNFYEISDLDWAVADDVEAREKIGERRLEGETDGDTSDSERGDEWCDGDVEIIEDDECGDGVDDRGYDSVEKLWSFWSSFLGGESVVGEEFENLAGEECEDGNLDDEKSVLESFWNFWRQGECADREMDSEDADEPETWFFDGREEVVVEFWFGFGDDVAAECREEDGEGVDRDAGRDEDENRVGEWVLESCGEFEHFFCGGLKFCGIWSGFF